LRTRPSRTIGYTIGAYIVFPANKVDAKQTLNGALGFNCRICDRMDLTLECIRRHYLRQDSPLGATLERHGDFFALFDDFRGYVDYFLLQDLVSDDYCAVKYLIPFDHFNTWPIPGDVEATRITGVRPLPSNGRPAGSAEACHGLMPTRR
jgi:hypothetical protein